MNIRKILFLCIVSLVIGCPALNAEILKDLIPGAEELTGFAMAEAPMYYTTDNLWDYIDGAAPGYLAFGFREVVTFIVMNNADSTEFVVDIYDMADSLNAFGIYSVEKAPKALPVDLGSQAFQAGNMLCFWQDCYYIKLIAYAESTQTAASLTRIGKSISRKLPEQGSLPALFLVFPKEQRQAGSARYMARDVLGQEYLTHGYRLTYNSANDQEYHIFLIPANDETAAHINFTHYYNYFRKNGRVTDEHLTLGDEAFAGTDRFYGSMNFVRQGKYLIGVFGLAQPSAARKIIEAMCRKL